MRLRWLAVVGIALVLGAAGRASGQGIEDEKATVDARIAALQAEIEASKQQEGVLTTQLSAIASELESAQAAVDSAQSSVSSLEAQLASARSRLDQLIGPPRPADSQPRTPAGGACTGGRDPRGARAGDVHRRAAGHSLVPRVGDELRRPHRQRRAFWAESASRTRRSPGRWSARRHEPRPSAVRLRGRSGCRRPPSRWSPLARATLGRPEIVSRATATRWRRREP